MVRPMCPAGELGQSGPWLLSCDEIGRPEITLPMGALDLCGKEVPVELAYSMMGLDGLLLPSGWRMPILESCTYQIDEEMCAVVFPNGELQHLRIRKDGSPKENATAVQKGSRLDVTRDGCQYVFEKGVLASMHSEADQIKFLRDEEGRVSRLIDRNNRTLLSATHSVTGSEGTAIIDFGATADEGRKRHTIKYDHIPSLIKESVKQRDADFIPGLRSVQFPNGESSKIDCSRRQGGGLLSIAPPSGKEKPLEVSWDASGRTQQAGLCRLLYFDLLEGGKDAKRGESYRPFIESLNLSTGARQILQQGEARPLPGLEVFFDKETKIERTYAVTATGTRLRRETVNGVESYRAWFDETGQIIRDKRGEFERRLVDGKYVVLKGNEVVREY
jgi:hypothetical protein